MIDFLHIVSLSSFFTALTLHSNLIAVESFQSLGGFVHRGGCNNYGIASFYENNGSLIPTVQCNTHTRQHLLSIDRCVDADGHSSRKFTRLHSTAKGNGKQGTGDQQQNTNNLDKFRSLMGTLYGIAGIAHLYDCIIGPSQLLSQAGISPFYELSLLGQVIAIIWCLAGPLAFLLSRKGGAIADLGLISYGVIEVSVASFSPVDTTIINALFVQVIVLASWIYSREKGDEE